MLRRDILNIFFGNATTAAVTQETVASIDTPAYLKMESTKPFVQEFWDLAVGHRLALQVSTSHAFSISWSAHSESGDTSLQLGVNTNTVSERSAIALGLHMDSCLYIGEVMDKRKLNAEQLIGNFQLKLDVNAQAANLSYAKLTLTDCGGLTIAMVKNTQYANNDWRGDIIIVGQQLKYLKIEGRELI